jgi:hypothetical protein
VRMLNVCNINERGTKLSTNTMKRVDVDDAGDDDDSKTLYSSSVGCERLRALSC